MHSGIYAACSLVLGSLSLPAQGQDFVPFVIPLEPPDAGVAAAGEAIAADSPRVAVADGHFVRDGRRVRVWGVNLCFGANFPTHADAERVAARMAGAGINSVRFHHMDNTAFPRGIWDPTDPRRLSADALDRLCYLIDRLARHGIMANINLHVSRTHSRILKLPDADKLPTFDKMVDLFTPELIDAQKRYAAELLGHVNPYRKVRLADDPAVAFVEINNEDSLFMWSAAEELPALPPHYAKLLRDRFAAWLKARHGDTAALRRAWAAGSSPLGENLLTDAAFATLRKPEAERRWVLERHEGCQAEAAPLAGTPRAVRVTPSKIDATSWHIQLSQGGARLERGAYYTARFRARAERPRRITVNVSMAHDPWQGLGMARSLELTAQWQSFRIGFEASDDDPNARLSFLLGADAAAVELADVELLPGGREGLGEDESIEAANVELWRAAETDARAADRWRFLADTEKGYFDDMRQFVKDQVGCKALVTGTIVFGPLGLYGQSGMDYIDGHAYWQHPHFPGRPWDPANWLVEQKAMVDHPKDATLGRLSAERLAGKPFTVSEYNHPAPNDYQAECVPMVAAWAAAQDWDGVWLFAYSHETDRWNEGRFASFFDIQANPAKWGFIRAGTAIFRDGPMGPLANAITVPLAGGDGLADLVALHRAHGSNLLAACQQRRTLDPEYLQDARLAVSLAADAAALPAAPSQRHPMGVSWRLADDGRGRFTARSDQAIVWIGHAAAPGELGKVNEPLERPAFAAIALTALDGKPITTSSKILITACGRAENTGMQFSADRRTVGRNWGGPPVRIEAVSATLMFRLSSAEYECHALKSDGRPGPAVPMRDPSLRPYEASIRLDPKYGTMWYLLRRK